MIKRILEFFVFDKNEFKKDFLRWINNNPFADEAVAEQVCRNMLPVHELSSNQWLIEQSIQWFLWLRQQRIAELQVKNELM